MGKERLYRVLVIAISLRSNKIAVFGDEILESQFAAPIADLIAGDYIEEVSKDSKESDDEAAKLQEEQAKIEADKKAEEEAAKLEEEEAKNAEANKTKTDESDKKDDSASLGDIANSIPGAKATPTKK